MYRTAVDKYLSREVAGREVLKEIRPTSAQIYKRGREVPGREVLKPMPTTNCVPYG